MSESAEEKRKIIVDEDWKTQVERERAQQRAAEQAGEPGAARPASEPSDEGMTDDGLTVRPSSGPLPPASFEMLITAIATQTLACLGQLPDPIENKPIVQLELAQHHIDTLGMLAEKTQGNLTQAEAHALDEMLHQLRMLFVAVKQHVSR
jgi:hypothetical protein